MTRMCIEYRYNKSVYGFMIVEILVLFHTIKCTNGLHDTCQNKNDLYNLQMAHYICLRKRKNKREMVDT